MRAYNSFGSVNLENSRDNAFMNLTALNATVNDYCSLLQEVRSVTLYITVYVSMSSLPDWFHFFSSSSSFFISQLDTQLFPSSKILTLFPLSANNWSSLWRVVQHWFSRQSFLRHPYYIPPVFPIFSLVYFLPLNHSLQQHYEIRPSIQNLSLSKETSFCRLTTVVSSNFFHFRNDTDLAHSFWVDVTYNFLFSNQLTQ